MFGLDYYYLIASLSLYFDGDGASASRPKAAAPERAKAGAAKAGGAEFEDFPGALEDEDDDLPF